MVDRLRLLLNRPLRDSDRRRLFALAAVVIAATAVVLAQLDDSGPSARPSRSRKPSATPWLQAASPEPAITPSPTPAAPSEEGNPPIAERTSRAEVSRSKRAGRRFLAGYLPYSYGRARHISAATTALRRRLQRERPRVPARERRRRPGLVLLQSQGVSGQHAGLLAVVSDGARRYTIELELVHRRAGWAVSDVEA